MKGKSYIYAGALTLALATALSLSASITQANTKHDKKPKVPVIRVDPSWPKMPLPSAGDLKDRRCLFRGS